MAILIYRDFLVCKKKTRNKRLLLQKQRKKSTLLYKIDQNRNITNFVYGIVVQWLERCSVTAKVGGSSPLSLELL